MNGAVGAAVIGGFFLVLVLDLALHAEMPIGVLFFSLIFPAVCALAVLVALTTATMTFDRSGWTFTRNLLGHVREQDSGTWSQVAATVYRQWYVPGGRGGGGTLYGELLLFGPASAVELRARTAFFVQGNPTARHSAGKRMIGLQPEEFDAFVQLIDRETPHLGYVWRRVDVDPEAKFGGFLARPGPPHYVCTSRGQEAPIDGAESADPLETQAGDDDFPADVESAPLPTWRGQA